MHFTTFIAPIFGVVALAIAAPAQSNPPELKALFRELRDYRCGTGGIDSRAIYTTDVGKCLKFKNPLDTAGIKVTFLEEKCNLLVYLDNNCEQLGVQITRALCWGDDVVTFGSATVQCEG